MISRVYKVINCRVGKYAFELVGYHFLIMNFHIKIVPKWHIWSFYTCYSSNKYFSSISEKKWGNAFLMCDEFWTMQLPYVISFVLYDVKSFWNVEWLYSFIFATYWWSGYQNHSINALEGFCQTTLMVRLLL